MIVEVGSYKSFYCLVQVLRELRYFRYHTQKSWLYAGSVNSPDGMDSQPHNIDEGKQTFKGEYIIVVFR